MESSVFFKFKSQKEPTRVDFDGTGISVFELKKDIIIKSGLGDGTDFDLAIYDESGKEEYDDDTTIIPRTTVVSARRLPASKPGAGRAARYVTGKMPTHAKNAARKDQTAKDAEMAREAINKASTEEEKMKAMFQAQIGSWSANREDLAHEKPVFHNKSGSHRPANVPDHEPPNGYICYRCGEKGHWIQLCPTNDDPDFNNRRRVKRTTGIPRSFLTTVDKDVALAQNAGDDESKRPAGIMVNADGDFVIARTDKEAWQKYQDKVKSSAAANSEAVQDLELQTRGFECPMDKKMFIEPMKTPCCGKTYCSECIINALIESDFVCPSCKSEGILIDDLKPDDEVTDKIKTYMQEKERANEKAAADERRASQSPPSEVKPGSHTPTDVGEKSPEKTETDSAATSKPSNGTSPKPATAAPTQSASPSAPANAMPDQAMSRKRPADELLENPKIPKAPKAMQKQTAGQEMQNGMMDPSMMGMPNMGMGNMGNMMPFPGMNMMGMPGMGPMPNMPNMPNMSNMPNMANMPNMGMPGMGMPMMNPMMGMGMNGGFGMGGQNNNMFGGMGPGMNNGFPNGNMNGGMNGGYQNGYQGQRNFGNQGNIADEDAYFRKPVNPHRHQNRQRRIRPSDYRELG